jgi:two-component system sensor histidine kinase PilS (NtrC family)
LLRNAADAMTAGGTITVKIARESTGGDGDGDGGGDGQPWTRLTVADTGSGIPKADLDHIFEPFFSTKSGGSGLGLPTVARIVDDHRGTIEVDSEAGRGTTVVVRLPATRAAVAGAWDHAA